MPTFVSPCVPVSRPAPPRGAGWLHEAKFDGWRAQVIVADGAVRLLTRSGHDLGARVPALAASLLALDAKAAIVDCELVAPRADGSCDFAGLSSAIATRRVEGLLLWAFDLLYLDGVDLRARALVERKADLADVLSRSKCPAMSLSAVFDDGEALLRAAEAHGLEGVVSKRASSPYVSGRCSSWTKVKTASWREANRVRWRHFVRQ
jgi:bifunctional non-homologous end joining protein LigD